MNPSKQVMHFWHWDDLPTRILQEVKLSTIAVLMKDKLLYPHSCVGHCTTASLKNKDFNHTSY